MIFALLAGLALCSVAGACEVKIRSEEKPAKVEAPKEPA